MPKLKQVDLLIEVEGEYISVDIDQTTTFPFNLQLSDFTNPTATRIPYSSQISLPKTKVNNDIFNHILEYDQQVFKFNPISRNNFRLYVNNEIYQSGYIKLETVTLTSYNIRLYGGLGDFFYLLSEVSGDRDMRIKKLDLDGLLGHKINKETLKKCWDENGGGISKEYFDYSTGKKVTNEVLSYAMVYQGKYENFDSDSVIGEDEEGQTTAVPVEWYNNKGKESTAPSLNEHSRNTEAFSGEYRSYYQRPMLRLSMLYNKIIEKITAEGWTVELDNTFFNKYNPYWNDLWIMCPQYDTTSDNSAVTLAVGEKADNTWFPDPYNFNGQKYDEFFIPTTYKKDIDKDQTYHVTVNLPFKIYAIQDGSSNKYLMLKRDELRLRAALFMDGVQIGEKLLYKEGAGNQISLTENTVGGKRPHDWSGSNNFYYDRLGPGDGIEKNSKSPTGDIYTFTGAFKLNGSDLATREKLTIKFEVDGDTWWKRYKHGDKDRNEAVQIHIQEGARILISNDYGAGLRSDSDVKLTDIIRSENTCYDFLTSYGKIFGLYYVKDVSQKKVSIVTRNTFFSKQEKLDWTHKIDYSKGVEMNPVPFDYKTGIFKWNNIGTKYEDTYLAETGKEYGSARFDTKYQFSNEEKNYLDNIIFDNCVIATDYSPYYLDRESVLYKDNKTLPFLQDNSGEKIEASFILAFKDGFKKVETPFAISDDEDEMLTYGYCWTNKNYVLGYSYPNIVKLIGNKGTGCYSLNFGNPVKVYNEGEENFISDTSTTEGAETIYARFWSGYLNDRFHKNNKILTCYVLLSLEDIRTNLFNKFIYINDTVWVVERIVNFNPLSNAPTKVVLSNVQSTSAYLAQQYIEGNLTISRDGNIMYDASGSNNAPSNNPVIIKENSEKRSIDLKIDSTVEWRIGELTSNVTVNKSGGGEGLTDIRISIAENSSGSALYTNVPIIWGNTTTIVQMVQVSNWTVTTSTNAGTSLAEGGGESGASIRVSDSAAVTLSTEADDNWTFGYWIIDGVYNTSRRLSFVVTKDVNAEANWFDAGKYIIMITNDNDTSISAASRYFDRWILEIGTTYTFVNNQPNLSGYLFGEDTTYTHPSGSVSRQVTATDSKLQVFYDTLLANMQVMNESDMSFDTASIHITSPSAEKIPSPAEVVASGGEAFLRYAYETTDYGTYTFTAEQPEGKYIDITPASLNYQQKCSIPTIVVTVSDLRWESRSFTAVAGGETITNTLTIPSNLSYTIESDTPGVVITPSGGTESRSIAVKVPASTEAERTIKIIADIYKGTTLVRQEEFSIEQDSGLFEPEISLSRYEDDVHGGMSELILDLQCNTTWSASVDQEYISWLSVEPKMGEGNKMLMVSASLNPTNAPRTGFITFTTTYGANDVSVTYKVNQDI